MHLGATVTNTTLFSLKKAVVLGLRKCENSASCRPVSHVHTHFGPRHDDITYQSIAKAFNLPIKLYPEAYERMKKLSKPRPGEGPFDWDVDSPARKAKLRMVELPTDDAIPAEKQFLFPRQDLWVPVAVVNGNVHILPGVPRLCKSLYLISCLSTVQKGAFKQNVSWIILVLVY